MGIIRRGILGGFRNKVGTVVGARYCGLDVVRSLPAKSEKEATRGQLTLDWVEDTVHVYMVLSAAKGVGKGASDTLYMGQSIVS